MRRVHEIQREDKWDVKKMRNDWKAAREGGREGEDGEVELREEFHCTHPSVRIRNSGGQGIWNQWATENNSSSKSSRKRLRQR